MKRLISAILILLMLIPSAFALGEGSDFTVSLTGGNVTQLGDTVTVYVRAQNAPSCSAFRFFFTYDDTVLEYVSDKTLSFNGYLFVDSNPFDDGRAKIGIAAASGDIGFRGNADLCSVTFRVKKDPAGAKVFTHYYHEFFETGTGTALTPTIEINTVTYRPNLVTVPDLLGVPQAEAVAALTDLQLAVVTQTGAYDPRYDEGDIIAQSVPAHTELSHGESVTLTVNGPRPLVSVPNVIGKQLDVAKAELEALGFQVSTSAQAFTPGRQENEVVDQSVAANGQLPLGSTIILTVISAAENKDVPSVEKTDKSTAIAALEALGFIVNWEAVPYTLGYAENEVISQSHPAGTVLSQGNTINLTVNGAPANVMMPDLTGKTKEAALNLLLVNKFDAQPCIIKPYSLAYEPNHVISQSVQAYLSHPQGSPVTLTVNGMPQNVAVPSLIGLSNTEAIAALNNLQLKCSSVPAAYDMNYPAGTVILQSVPADSGILQGETVTLTINGLPGQTVVPALAGITYPEAVALLAHQQLKATYVETSFNRNYAPGTVVEQNIAAGTQATQGSTVTLTLNGQPQTLSIPSLKGKTKAEAEALLAANQYHALTQIGPYNKNYGADAVIDQSVIGPLLQGSTVTLTLNGAKPPMQNPFTDVPANTYYTNAVLWAVENGITNGMSKTEFKPNDTCTRGQIVTFLWRAAGEPKAQNRENPFTDNKSTKYYYEAVLWAVENGITNGMSKTEFKPDETCTREQIVTFLWRSQGQPQYTGPNPFADLSIKSYAYNAVLWAVENNITNGMGNNQFQPKGKCTRGQIVTFLYRTMA